MPFVRSSGATIHYMTLPAQLPCSPARQAITFIHGGGGNNQAFLYQMPYFAEHGFLAISISVRGWGSSLIDDDDPNLLSYEHLAADVMAVLDACSVPRTAIVGHSIGGFFVTRMAVEAPHRLTHAIMSSTFYGLADEWISRYIEAGPMGCVARHEVAAEIKAQLPSGSSGSTRHSRGCKDGRAPGSADNFSEEFRREKSAIAWLYDSMNDANAQVRRLELKSRFKLLQATGAVSPSTLRSAYHGPLCFLITESDAAIHWECVEHVALQCKDLDNGRTIVHCFADPNLKHAPHIEAAEEYNRVLLDFLTSP